ncbi:MAG: YdeI/OmpD-associated family protein [Patescibacteria group bacterium]
MFKKVASGVVHKVPTDLREMLVADIKVLDAWQNITPLARNEWLCWVESAKKSETREKRIKRVANDLLNGKKRHCCWPGCTHR